MEEIDEGGGSWPHFSHIGFLGVAFRYVNVSFEAVLIGRATGLDACVNDGYVSVSLQYLIESVQGESVLIDCEILIIDHVVDISPDSIEGNTVTLVSRDYILEVGDVLVSPATLMEA